MHSKRSISRTWTIAWPVVGWLVAGAFVCAQAQAFDPNQEVVVPAEKRQYQPINPKIEMAGVWGDRSKGEHGTFGQFPANFMTPFHAHTGAYHGVVIKGIMTNPFQDETNPPKMGSGSYWYVPAKAIHATACVSDTPCEFYFHADKAFDFHPVKQ